jgi:hypothetical protein
MSPIAAKGAAAVVKSTPASVIRCRIAADPTA